MDDDEGELTDEEQALWSYKRGLLAKGANPTEDALVRFRERLEAQDEVSGTDADEVSARLSTQDRYDIYEQVLGMLRSGESDEHIAAHVVGLLNTHIESKIKRVKNRKKGKSPIFRRVE